MSFAEITEGYTPRESTFSSLLAAENISVTFEKTARTASFNLDTRHLILPVYRKDIPSFLVDTLIYHEVAHALFSDVETWKTLVPKYGKSVTNVFEDIVIEHAIKNRYPGAARLMPRGHHWKYENIFEDNINEDNFLSRHMAHFKTGGLLPIRFTDEERAFNAKITDMVRNGATTEELILAWKEFNDSQDEPESDDQGQPDPSEDEGEDGNESESGEDSEESDDSDEDEESGAGEDGEDGENGEDGEDSEESDDSDTDEDTDADSGAGDEPDEDEDQVEAEADGEGDDEGESSESDDDADEDGDESDTDKSGGNEAGNDGGDNDLDPISSEDGEDDDIEVNEPDEGQLTEASQIDNEYNLPTVLTLTSDMIRSYVDKVEYSLNWYWENYNGPNLESLHEYAKNAYARFDDETTKAAREMVIQFNQLADARSLSDASEYDTGELDTDLLTEYRTRDDLFTQEVVQPGGVDHGFFAMIDLSGSMFPSRRTSKHWVKSPFYRTMRQVIVMAKFCQMAGLPYRAYGFTRLVRGTRVELNELAGDHGITCNHGIVRLFHDADPVSVQNEALKMMMLMTGAATKSRNCKYIAEMISGGTPLTTMTAVIPYLVAGMNCEKLSATILTDGCGSPLEMQQGGCNTRFTSRSNNSIKFAAPEFGPNIYPIQFSGAAQFVKDVLPDVHLTYYYIGYLGFDQGVPVGRINLLPKGSDSVSYRVHTDETAPPSKTTQIDAERYMGFDAIFLVNTTSSSRQYSAESSTEGESAVSAKLRNSKALRAFEKANSDLADSRQFASEFIRNVA